jgi:hypothetical protein
MNRGIAYLETGGYIGKSPIGGHGKSTGLAPLALPKLVNLLNGVQMTKSTYVPLPIGPGP